MSVSYGSYGCLKIVGFLSVFGVIIRSLPCNIKLLEDSCCDYINKTELN